MGVRLVPLGGLGEIGLNCLAIESGGEILVVDAGLMFPSGPPAGLGVEYVVPDLTWLVERKDGIRGVLLTHAHEDHIGALPWLLSSAPATLYGSRFTLARARQKLSEHGVVAPLVEATPRARIALGRFEVEPLRVTHSTPQALGYAVHTAEGVVVHTGDFKIDQRPVDGQGTDLARLAELGQVGVMALLSDSTNAEREGWSPSEAEVGAALRRLMDEAPGRVVLALFGSNVHRVELAARAARATGRKLALAGRSLIANCALAEELGIIEGGFWPLERAADVRPRDLVLVCTGAQAEPRGALARLVAGEVPELRLAPGDTVVFSARPIPGNEVAVSALVNALCKQGVRVLAGEEAERLHATGHAHAEEERLVLGLTRPRAFVPVHGEYRMLWRHAQIAKAAGVEQVILAEDGQVVELSGGEARLAGTVRAGRVHLDAGSLLPMAEAVLRDRRRLAQDGVVVALVAIQGGAVARGPELVARGVPEDVLALEEARRAAAAEVAGLAGAGPAAMEEALVRAVRRAFRKEAERRPLVLPVVMVAGG